MKRAVLVIIGLLLGGCVQWISPFEPEVVECIPIRTVWMTFDPSAPVALVTDSVTWTGCEDD